MADATEAHAESKLTQRVITLTPVDTRPSSPHDAARPVLKRLSGKYKPLAKE
jgi:hypothetical protein